MHKLTLPGLALAVTLTACAPADTAPEESSSSAPSSTTTTAESSGDPGTTPADDPAFDQAGLNMGPGRAFPALDDPPMVPGATADWLDADDIVLGIISGDEAHAFPASQLAYHHIVNTSIGGEPFLVTY